MLNCIARAETGQNFEEQQQILRKALAAKPYLSLVFASENHRSPASMFGHIFLVAHQEIIPEADAVTIEFSVPVPRSTPQALKALLFNVSGHFVLRRLYEKNLEYDLEDRDLFRFPLQYNEQMRKRLLARLDEFGKNPYPYNFFHRNCASYLDERLFSVYYPNEHARSPDLYVKPFDLIKRYQLFERSDQPSITPSSLQILDSLYEKLDANDKALFDKLSVDYSSAPLTTDEALRNAYSAKLDYLLPREEVQSRRNILSGQKIKYAPTIYSNDEIDVQIPIREHYWALGISNKGTWLNVRPELSSHLDTVSSELKDTRIMETSMSYQASQFRLEKLSIVEFSNFYDGGPHHFAQPFNSYVFLGYRNYTGIQSDVHTGMLGRIGSGISWIGKWFSIGTSPFLGYQTDLKVYNAEVGEYTRVALNINNMISVNVTREDHLLTNLTDDLTRSYTDVDTLFPVSKNWSFIFRSESLQVVSGKGSRNTFALQGTF